jgi:hypothetical protein
LKRPPASDGGRGDTDAPTCVTATDGGERRAGRLDAGDADRWLTHCRPRRAVPQS